jgi:hypothetical protein
MGAKLGRQDQVTQAAELIRQAIQLLDAAGAPGDIAAHLDLAATRIDELAGAEAVNHGSTLQSPKSDAAQAG